jgi:NTP pyrophosphatase (non-canonical NTP hydrolase)
MPWYEELHPEMYDRVARDILTWVQTKAAKVVETPTVPAKSLRDLVSRAYATSVSHGWLDGIDPRDPLAAGAAVALMHSELSEVLEELRHPTVDYTAVAAELADVLIRVFVFAGALELDLDQAVMTKMDENDKRPHRHGGKRL